MRSSNDRGALWNGECGGTDRGENDGNGAFRGRSSSRNLSLKIMDSSKGKTKMNLGR